MKTSVPRTLAVTLMLASIMAADSTAKPWRGLTPARSTRLDVARVSPECENANMRCTFRLADSEIMIIFSGGDIGDGKCEKLPSGTVLAIKIRYTHPQELESFRIKKKVILFDPTTPSNREYKGYYYPEDGFIISTFKGQVFEVVYIARRKDLRRCPEYYDDPKGFVEILS